MSDSFSETRSSFKVSNQAASWMEILRVSSRTLIVILSVTIKDNFGRSARESRADLWHVPYEYGFYLGFQKEPRIVSLWLVISMTAIRIKSPLCGGVTNIPLVFDTVTMCLVF